ncbi:hypothetical protein MASR2M17_04440 [Aminivibrio sp.]
MTVFLSGIQKDLAWSELEERVKKCTRCALSSSRRNAVFGEGSRTARVIFVGEAPGADEDARGLPFVGKAGHLLTQILSSVGIDRKDVFITNIVKCRPPEDRAPVPDEMMDCAPYLEAQLALLPRP